MNTKKASAPLVIGFISAAICFSFGFFVSVLKYNGFEFFCTYVIFLLLFSYPINLVTVYLHKILPNLNSHNKLIVRITGSSKFNIIGILFIGIITILVSLLVFNISVYLLNLFNGFTSINKSRSFNLDGHLSVYICLTIVFMAVTSIFILSSLNKLNLNKALKVITYLSLGLVTILVIVAICSQGVSGVKNFIFNLNNSYQEAKSFNSMLSLALVYAVLSNFISIAFYKNVINIVDNDYKRLKISSLTSLFYNILFCFMMCVAIYALLGNYQSHLKAINEVELFNVFEEVRLNSFSCYLLLEIVTINLNFIVLVLALKYISQIETKIYTKAVILLIPFVIVVGFIADSFPYLSFYKMFGLHLVIIFLFIFDIFVFGWIYDAQKLSYEILKNTNTKLAASFNITLRIVIPFICIYIAIDYIFATIPIAWQFAVAMGCMIIYIISASISSKMLNKRRF